MQFISIAASDGSRRVRALNRNLHILKKFTCCCFCLHLSLFVLERIYLNINVILTSSGVGEPSREFSPTLDTFLSHVA